MKIDLHLHSTASDGTDAPARAAELCAEAGLTHAVLTDHDTTAGSAAFVARAAQLGIQAVSGIEFSAAYEGELHILCYDADFSSPAFTRMVEEMAATRRTRITAMTQKLMDAGYGISHELVSGFAAGGIPTRPHIGRALVAMGYAPDLPTAFARFLNAGCPGFVPRVKASEDLILQTVQDAGGKAVLAHPLLTQDPDMEGLVARLASKGLAGIEAFYPRHNDAHCAWFCSLAEKYHLFATQGSDYHGVMRAETWLGKETRGQGHPLVARGLAEIFQK